MKKMIKGSVLLAGLIATTCFYACKKSNNGPTMSAYNMSQVNLVADVSTFNAAHIDTNLVNAWGLSATATAVWPSSTGKGVGPVYDKTGATLRAPVTIPSVVTGKAGTPTGVIFNSTTSFGANKFIFASLDGSINAWATGNLAIKVASQTGAVYTGLAMATNNSANFLYAANFKTGKVDVYDSNFISVSNMPFADPNIPAGFAPFNVQGINGMLYVTYAMQGAGGSVNGVGNGYVDIFTTAGVLVKRFASTGSLNSPWGLALAPAGFADVNESILVGNFGDGHINVFDTSGNFKGQLQSNGSTLAIDGLWAIDFFKGNVSGSGSTTDFLYFTAGPGGEKHGLFGYLKLQ